MEVISTYFGAVLELALPRFGDPRGQFTIVWNDESAAAVGIDRPFVQDNESISANVGTVRGLHLQADPVAQGKLVRVSAGAIIDFAVDLRPGSPTFAEHIGIEISDEKANAVWVPPGFAHGFATLKPNTTVSYKVDAPWSPEHERAIFWADPDLDISWPVDTANATISDKDAVAPSFAAFQTTSDT